ncbi:hypothetical protein ABT160_07495 [Streptomyces sp. NPDC001941]|uniref:hypothetical protein n=1 Tax=Streptomyces sp. NPDC001941 TaxID=3154659 RepID=UPI003326F5F6
MRRIDLGGSTGRAVVTVLAVLGLGAGLLVGFESLSTIPGCGTTESAYPSLTAQDWRAGADHVIVATPTREQPSTELRHESGPWSATTQRTVGLRVDTTLWSAPKPRHTLGTDISVEAPGWRTSRTTQQRIDDTDGARPRLETGHTYLLALRWTGAQWLPLGEGAVVPFDNHTVGNGEWCGQTYTPEEFAEGEKFSRKDARSLEETLLGQDEKAVRQELARTPRQP